MKAQYMPASALPSRNRNIPHNSFWFVSYPVPGGRSFLAVMDDFGNLREVNKERAIHSTLQGTA